MEGSWFVGELRVELRLAHGRREGHQEQNCALSTPSRSARTVGDRGFSIGVVDGRRKPWFPAPVFSSCEDDPVTAVMELTRCVGLSGRLSLPTPPVRIGPQSTFTGCVTGVGSPAA